MEETHFCVNRQVKARRKEAGSHLQKKCCTKSEHGVHVTKRKEVKALQKKNQQLQEDDPSNNITAGRLTMKCGIFTKGKTSGLISKGLSTEMQARAEANLARILELANPEEDDQRNVLSPSPDASLPDETTNLNDACPAQCCSHRENVRKSSPQANSKSNASTSKKAKQDKTRGKSRTRVAKTRYARQDIHSSFSGITELVSESEDQKTSRSGSRRSSETDRDLSVSNVQEKKLVVDYQRFLSSIGAKLDESITILEEEGGDVVADTKNNLLNIWKRHGSHRSIPSSTNSASSASCCIGLSVSCDGGSPSVSRTMKRRDKVTSRTNEAVDPLPSALDFSIHPEQVISSPRMLLAKYEHSLRKILAQGRATSPIRRCNTAVLRESPPFRSFLTGIISTLQTSQTSTLKRPAHSAALNCCPLKVTPLQPNWNKLIFRAAVNNLLYKSSQVEPLSMLTRERSPQLSMTYIQCIPPAKCRPVKDVCWLVTT